MNLLISIHPRHVDKILSGEKKWEYRKSIFRKDKDEMDRAYIYSTSPVKKIVASFEIGRVVKGSPQELWKKTKEESGTDKQSFMEYFDDHRVGYGIEIKNLKEFEEAVDPYKEIEDWKTPQNFYYLKENLN